MGGGGEGEMGEEEEEEEEGWGMPLTDEPRCLCFVQYWIKPCHH